MLALIRRHFVASRFFSYARQARLVALEHCIDWIEEGEEFPFPSYVATRLDARIAISEARNAREWRDRAIQSRYAR